MLLSLETQYPHTILKVLQKTGETSLLEKLEQEAKGFLEAIKNLKETNIDMNQEEANNKVPKNFSEFDMKTAKEIFSLIEKESTLFTNIQEIPISDWLKKSIEKSKHKSLNSEKERSEILISPILTEIEEMNDFSFKIFSGARLNIDSSRGLTGEFDFAFSQERTSNLEAPIFTVVEAKQADITKHWGQLVAQMIGAREENKKQKKDLKTIFGCVTSGEQWRFAKLENDCVYIDTETYYLLQIEKILGIFQYIVDFYESLG